MSERRLEMHGVNEPARPFQGVKVLYLEDEVIVLMLHQQTLEGFGCVVRGCTSLAEALEAVEQDTFDVGILDVNMHGKPSFPVAELLLQRGVGVAFLSGYQSAALEKPWGDFPLCEKPCTEDDIRGLLQRALARRPAVPS
jgi:CheY-like chemotaxis protein